MAVLQAPRLPTLRRLTLSGLLAAAVFAVTPAVPAVLDLGGPGGGSVAYADRLDVRQPEWSALRKCQRAAQLVRERQARQAAHERQAQAERERAQGDRR